MTSSNEWHAMPAADVASALRVDVDRGLDDDDAAARQAAQGRNALPERPPPSWARIFVRQFASPLIALLVVAALIALAIGERTDAMVIVLVVLLNALIGAAQEGRAERSLAALKKLTDRSARVRRDGKERTIPAEDVVVGDVIVVDAGDAVVADARVVESATVLVAEAALTGESIPVAKSVARVAEDAALADRASMLFAGTFIAVGRAVAVVVATGPATEIGRLAGLTSTTREPPTPLERRVARLGRIVIALAAFLFVIVVALGFWRGVPMRDLLMVAISQIVGLVPEGLPVAMTVALAVGVQRMARRHAVIRRLSAVETLGATTVVCTDKTGTLTKNEMTATVVLLADGRRVDVTGTGYAPEGTLHEDGRLLTAADDVDLGALLCSAVLCNDASLSPPEAPGAPWRPVGDPTEVALVTLAWKGGLVPDDVRRRHRRRAELPFDSEARLMATEHTTSDGDTGNDVVYLKGAPESVLPLCQKRRVAGVDVGLEEGDASALRAGADALAGQALRVLAVAALPRATLGGERGFAALQGATLLGFVGELDPPRDEVVDAVARCRSAGIRPVMITGDHKVTGLAIARAVGIAHDGEGALEGRELAAMDDAVFSKHLSTTSVFARVPPAQKLRIVQLLQAQHEVVAMTGDGVNDAPALVSADVGVAMGRSGTEVARDAAKVVLVDDNFATLVAAVEEGRVVYGNLKKVVLLLLSTSFAEVLILLGAMALGHPPPFLAAQILWNNLVTEGVITVNLIMDPPDGDEMRRPPRSPSEPLVDRELALRMLVMVPTIVVVTLGWFLVRSASGVPASQVQTEAFTLLALCEWFNVLNCRSSRRSALAGRLTSNPWLLGGLVVGNVLQALVVFAPPLQHIFRTTALGPVTLLLLGVAGSVVLWVEELRKFVVRRRRPVPTKTPSVAATVEPR